MTTHYKIEGMTCNGCVAFVKEKLEGVTGISSVNVQLEYPQASIDSTNTIATTILDNAIGKYKLSETKQAPPIIDEPSLHTYKPLILIVLFLVGIAFLVQFPFKDFSFNLWMRHFMAGFFLTFSFFKFLNLSGFAESFAMYDIIAGKWKMFGFIYPFIELSLGVAYLINFDSTITNLTTLIVLSIGTIGVVKSNLSKTKIKCACLGDVFNLPMTKVTIFENLTMILMSLYMLLN